MNITQLSFSDEELNQLCSDYGMILILMCGIDNGIHTLEKKMLLSLITRAGFDNDNVILGKINHHSETRKIETTHLNRGHDHIRLFPIENVIFYELEKGICNIISKLDATDWRKMGEKHLLNKLKNALTQIKVIMDAKIDVLGEDHLHAFYNSLYRYCYLIADCSGKGFRRNKIVAEEQTMLDMIKDTFQIEGSFRDQHISMGRNANISINL